MATATQIVAYFRNKIARVEVDYDDVTFVISGVRAVNASISNLRVTVVRLRDGYTLSKLLLSGTETLKVETSLSSKQMIFTKTEVFDTVRGRMLVGFDGVAINCIFPA